jgi:hypothetical protein
MALIIKCVIFIKVIKSLFHAFKVQSLSCPNEFCRIGRMEINIIVDKTLIHR